MSVQAVGVSLEGRYFLLDDNTTLPIVGMLDINGDDTEDPDKCIVAIFQMKNGMFSGHDIREFDESMRIKTSS